jgi:hypothetical protein
MDDAEVQGIDLELHSHGQEHGNEHDHGGQPVEDRAQHEHHEVGEDQKQNGPVVTLWMSALSSWDPRWLERSQANSARRSHP